MKAELSLRKSASLQRGCARLLAVAAVVALAGCGGGGDDNGSGSAGAGTGTGTGTGGSTSVAGTAVTGDQIATSDMFIALLQKLVASPSNDSEPATVPSTAAPVNNLSEGVALM